MTILAVAAAVEAVSLCAIVGCIAAIARDARKRRQKPVAPTVFTMPPDGTLEYQAARWGVRAAEWDSQPSPVSNSDITHAKQLAQAYLSAAEGEPR